MSKYKIILFYWTFIISLIGFAQLKTPSNLYGLKDPVKNKYKNCQECFANLRKMPSDVLFGLERQGNNIVFIMNDVNWYNQLINEGKDGFAVDILRKSQYECGKPNKEIPSWAHKGYLMEPIYRKDLKDRAKIDKYQNVHINMGEIPIELQNEELEFNLLLIQGKSVCRYNCFYDIERHKWNLIDMGLFSDNILEDQGTDFSTFLEKTMQFVVPFEKDKAIYHKEDIQPIYDSLRLTEYTIRSIKIRAYASVEGSTERNLFLQTKRAQSIIDVLQSFQLDTIKQDIIASENWVELLHDIEKLPKYAFLKKLSKEEVKEKLNDTPLEKEIEPILKKHRKAILFLELERKTDLEVSSPDVVRKLFNEMLSKKEIEKALDLQKLIFHNIRNHKLPHELLEGLDIPKEVEYGLLLNNDVMFEYEQNQQNVLQAIQYLKELEELIPNNAQIKYNLCALRLEAWVSKKLDIEHQYLSNNIIKLKHKIDRPLWIRLLINYHILLSEYEILHRNYKAKDRAVAFIYNNYRSLKLSSEDILNVASYFVSYTKYQWAINLLLPESQKVDVNEDVLFYFLNLTIIDEALTKRHFYRLIMLNAININQKRYCTLFKSGPQGGITFQLLGNLYLKKTYCESCLK